MDNKEILVSVIVISYNAVRYIEQALKSCLDQTLKNIEIIIGDDGSDDGSLEVIKKYNDIYDNVSYFVMDRPKEFKNGVIGPFRVSEIVKIGIERACGRYIVFLSADDYYTDMSKFEREVNLLKEASSKSACISNYKNVWDDGKEETENIHAGNRIYKSRFLFWADGYCHISAFLTRTSVFKNSGMLDRLCDDTGLCYLILRAGNVVCDDMVTFAYRQRGDSVTHSSDLLELAMIELMIFQDILNKYGFSISTGARFFKPFRYCGRNSELISDKKYEKYLISCLEYPFDMFEMIQDRRRSVSYFALYIRLFMCRVIFKICYCIRS